MTQFKQGDFIVVRISAAHADALNKGSIPLVFSSDAPIMQIGRIALSQHVKEQITLWHDYIEVMKVSDNTYEGSTRAVFDKKQFEKLHSILEEIAR